MISRENKKKFLQTYQLAIKKEQRADEEISFLKMRSEALQSSDNAAEINRRINELNKERLKCVSAYIEVERYIDKLKAETPAKTEKQQEVLRLRYIKNLPWANISLQMGVHLRYARAIHDSALDNLKVPESFLKAATNEERKEYLKAYQGASKRIIAITEEISHLEADANFPVVCGNGGRGSYSDLPEYMTIINEEIEKLKAEQTDRIKQCQDIEKQIRKINDEKEQRVLDLRYLKGMKWEDVAATMNYSVKRIHGIHLETLKHLEA